MTCGTCGNKKAYILKIYGSGGKRVEQCDSSSCTAHFEPSVGGIGSGLRIRNIESGSIGKRTVAHDRDIRSRRLSPEDGKTVIRVNPGRVSFAGFGLR